MFKKANFDPLSWADLILSVSSARLSNNKKGKTPMIITALKLQEATKEAVHDEMTMAMASHLFAGRDTMSDEDFTRMLFEYSATLASLTATLATHALLTEEQLDAMISEIKEFDQLGKDALNGND